MKVLLGSNSYKSINKEVVDFLITDLNLDLTYIDLLKEDIPIYSTKLEEEQGVPNYVQAIYEQIKATDENILIACPEYNGNYPAFFKNIIDWLTRIDLKFLEGKRVKVLTVTPGKMCGASVRGLFENSLPFFGAVEVTTFGIGNYNDVSKNGKIYDISILHDLSEFFI